MIEAARARERETGPTTDGVHADVQRYLVPAEECGGDARTTNRGKGGRMAANVRWRAVGATRHRMGGMIGGGLISGVQLVGAGG